MSDVHTITPGTADDYNRAYRAYWEVRKDVTTAALRMLATHVLDAFPEAASLEAYGEYNEEGQINLRAQRVRNADGAIIAGWDAGGSPVGDDATQDRWDEQLSDFDDTLDFVAQINDEDYLDEHVFRFTT